MPARKLNVLVYAGSGTTTESVRHCLLTLRRLLYPNYAVIPVTEDALVKEPWQATCALLVIPGGADMGYSRVLNGAGNRRIAQYVRAGGRYLGLCAGGYYGSGRCEFEVGNKPLEVIGRRELGLFRGTCRGCAYPGFAYKSEAGARAVQITIHREAFTPKGQKGDKNKKAAPVDLPTSAYSYYNGGGVFVDAKSADNVQVLASYPDDIAVDGGKGRAAIIYCTVGEGAAILTGPHPEFEPANLSERPDLPHYDDLLRALRKDDESQSRVKFFKACLTKLGLELGNGSAIQPRLTALHVTTLYPDEVQELMYKWEEIVSKKGNDSFIRAENDTFRVLHPDSGPLAWPAEANVAAPLSDDDSVGQGYGQSNQKRFSSGMLMDLTDRALRYPKLSGLIGRVADGTAPDSETEIFRSILEAIANHEEEGDDASNPSAATVASLSTITVSEWRETWKKHRLAFDRTIDTIYKAVGRALLGHPDDTPKIDLEMKQEIWSSLVHSWEHKRKCKEEESRPLDDGDSDSATKAQKDVDDDTAGRLMQLVDEVAGDDTDDGTIKKIVIYEGGWPSTVAVFDYGVFYRALATYRLNLSSGSNRTHHPDEDYEWGNQLMYAKVTTSTNTLLEKNPKLLATLPTGFTVTATRQLAARGRGSNVWLAPEGQLILSTVINHPHRFGSGSGMGGTSGNRPVVFIQYLAAIAIVEAIHAYAPGFEALDVKLKWPNDIYALDTTSPRKEGEAPGYVKIGGILSYCAFQNGHYQVVLGIGLNAVNKKPTTSLEALVPPALREILLGKEAAATSKEVINVEKLLACVLVHMESLYKQFLRQSFAGELERRYYKHWLHTNQIVTLEAVVGTPRARVLGISADWGLLQVAEVVQTVGAASARGGDGEEEAQERLTGRVWKLQSDENSFDYWKGLVRTKS
ncbi:biotin holocarboxylase synthetase [Sporothrix stenoceras]|uniref:Biotin holocarboxylase synthetase n=1 Tax=Sporothrix stenoceras TaxID=5173 RepID=A0ABR3YKX1_9PEZI